MATDTVVEAQSVAVPVAAGTLSGGTQQSTVISSNALSGATALPQINQLLNQITAAGTNPFVSKTAVAGVQTQLQQFAADIQGNNGVVSQGDLSALETLLPQAAQMIATYGSDVATANTRMYIGAAVVAAIIIGIIVFRK